MKISQIKFTLCFGYKKKSLSKIDHETFSKCFNFIQTKFLIKINCVQFIIKNILADLRQLSDFAHPFQRFIETTPNGGLFPKPFNIAMKAKISTNATCGNEKEEFCRMADIYSPRYAKNRKLRIRI